MNPRFNPVDPRREVLLAQTFVQPSTPSLALNCHVEPFGGGFHHLFFLRVNGCHWAGRKMLQQAESGGWYISSLLKPWMLLGPLAEMQWENVGIALYYHGASMEQKQAAFNLAQARPDSEVHFPFPAIDAKGLEFVCPTDYWQCDDSLATQLDADEGHLREHCATLLETLSSPGTVILDPACSTGEFITHLSRALPERHCLGSDRSASMIDHARCRHATGAVEFFVADARDVVSSGLKCDVLILRFLNAEVMTRADARQTFHDIVACVNPGGTVLVFGHTPVLVPVPYMAQLLKLELLSSVAARPEQMELFQFYRLRVPLT
ncbi:isonocardicin synthase [Pseudomonas corrugata]|jgi:isonocardicin synthase|uniref:class I SAM-dependent methyltransferase n=1 Tax=Pseudomonas corrugata TaxID=47879 RepID=UPI00285E5A9F|nr:class I SAM-dependent methyltransferase [Pseudomonas corrugata]MDR7285707.1 isonocardicin synthase [Pseudomonas corrugata]